MPKENLSQLILEGLSKTDVNKSELARRVGVSPTYIGNLIRGVSPSAKGGVGRPKVTVVDRLARQLSIPISRMRLAAGYAPEEMPDIDDEEAQRLVHYFSELPRECQLDVLALTEALWRRRAQQQRPRKGDTIKTRGAVIEIGEKEAPPSRKRG
jgi:transcriptional regulator with XRE-family HTH domain